MSYPEDQLCADRALDAALAAVRQGAEAALADLGRMIAVDTRFPPGAGYVAFAALMEELVEPLGMAVRREEVPEALWRVPGGPAAGARVNLLADWPAGGPAGVGSRTSGLPVASLYFHVDTVGAAPGWSSDPFVLRREGDHLHGLGAADMKGAIVAALLALRAIRETGLELAYRPQLLLCTDEEGGLYPGIRWLAEKGLIGGHLLNFNGGALPRIWAGCFGSFNLLIRLTGRSAHSSGGPGGAGVNAIEAALPVWQALMALKAGLRTRASVLPPPPGSAGPLRPQLALATAEGGTCGGQVPERFEFVVSRRYMPEEDFAEARAAIEDAIRAAVAVTPGLECRIDLIGHLTPTADPWGPHWPRWQAAMELGFGYRPEDFVRWGAASASDSGYVQQAGISREILLGGLIRPESAAHAADEHTTVGDIVALARSITAYLAADFAADLNPDTGPEIGREPRPDPRQP